MKTFCDRIQCEGIPFEAKQGKKSQLCSKMKSSEIYIYNTHTLYINTRTIITEYPKKKKDKIK